MRMLLVLGVELPNRSADKECACYTHWRQQPKTTSPCRCRKGISHRISYKGVSKVTLQLWKSERDSWLRCSHRTTIYNNIQKGKKKPIFSLFGLLRQSVLISVHRRNIDVSLNECFFYILAKKTCTETAVWLCSVLGFSRAWRWATRKLQTSTTYQGPCQRNKIKWGLCSFHHINCVVGLLII